MTQYYDYQIKIIIVGDSGSGKSSLCRQLSKHTFDKNMESTIGVDFITRTFQLINNQQKLIHYKSHIWDTAGQETYRSLITSYYKGASGVILLFDLSKEDGFKHIYSWYDEIKMYVPEDSPIILVGNKSDLLQRVDINQIEKFTKEKKIPYIITSAKDHKNTFNCFMYLVNTIHVRFINEENVNVIKKRGVFYIDSDKSNNKRCCF